MPKVFDTNPLDPEFPEKAREKAKEIAETAKVGGYTSPRRPDFSTAEFPSSPGSVTEDETRRFEEAEFNSYTSRGGPPPPTPYEPPDVAAYAEPAALGMRHASNRKVPKTGVPEKWLIGLPYVPFSIGLVAGLILLLVIPKEENRVRFHAAQGLAAHIGILIVTTILGIVGSVADIAELGNLLFQTIANIMLIIFAIKAWRGKPVHIESLDDLTNWLEEKIGPIK